MSADNRRLRTCLMVALVAMLCVPAPSAAQTTSPDAPGKRERDAVHFTNALRADDPKLAETFDGALDSLQAGHDVVILFDGRSVTALRMNQRRGSRTPLEDMALAPAEGAAIAKRLGLPSNEAPRNRLELVQRLAAAGARVFVNRSAVRLYGLADTEIHPLATPVSARQLSDLLDETSLCYTYGR